MLPSGLHAYRVPDGTYAMADTTVSEMEYAYYTLYKNWLPASPNERDMQRPAVDIFSADGDGATIWIPIKPSP